MDQIIDKRECYDAEKNQNIIRNISGGNTTTPLSSTTFNNKTVDDGFTDKDEPSQPLFPIGKDGKPITIHEPLFPHCPSFAICSLPVQPRGWGGESE